MMFLAMKKNERDMIEEKTLKTWGDRVGVVSTLVGDSHLHLLLREASLVVVVDLGEAASLVVVDLVEDFQVGMNSTFDFSEEWTPLPTRFTKKEKVWLY